MRRYKKIVKKTYIISDKKHEVSNVSTSFDILDKPGDKLSARVTDSNRKVLKVEKDNGDFKYSATQYPNGTVVETKTTKKKRI